MRGLLITGLLIHISWVAIAAAQWAGQQQHNVKVDVNPPSQITKAAVLGSADNQLLPREKNYYSDVIGYISTNDQCKPNRTYPTATLGTTNTNPRGGSDLFYTRTVRTPRHNGPMLRAQCLVLSLRNWIHRTEHRRRCKWSKLYLVRVCEFHRPAVLEDPC